MSAVTTQSVPLADPLLESDSLSDEELREIAAGEARARAEIEAGINP